MKMKANAQTLADLRDHWGTTFAEADLEPFDCTMHVVGEQSLKSFSVPMYRTLSYIDDKGNETYAEFRDDNTLDFSAEAAARAQASREGEDNV